MSTKNRFIIFLAFLLGVGFLVLSVPQDSRAQVLPVSNCCVDHEETGCDNSECEDIVCDFNDFCCNVEWDSNCVGIAVELCGDLCPPPPGSNCCFPHFDNAGCDNSECEGLVCNIDDFCCNEIWDGNCVGVAIEQCGDLCPTPPGSDCCFQNGSPGCSDSRCQNTICNFDEFCCEELWDSTCVVEAEEFCEVCQVAPVLSPIPTMNQWGLIALAGILGLSALYILVRRNPLQSK